MIQEIVTLLIVGVALFYAGKNIYSFFYNFANDKVCSCNSCPAKNLMKELQNK